MTDNLDNLTWLRECHSVQNRIDITNPWSHNLSTSKLFFFISTKTVDSIVGAAGRIDRRWLNGAWQVLWELGSGVTRVSRDSMTVAERQHLLTHNQSTQCTWFCNKQHVISDQDPKTTTSRVSPDTLILPFYQSNIIHLSILHGTKYFVSNYQKFYTGNSMFLQANKVALIERCIILAYYFVTPLSGFWWTIKMTSCRHPLCTETSRARNTTKIQSSSVLLKEKLVFLITYAYSSVVMA